MANKEHLSILQNGVGAWNHWRHENKHIEPDLSGVSFLKADFRRVDFRDTNLSGADLSECILSEAQFCHSILTGVKFCNSILFRADFFTANLTEADLTGANLEYAVMVETNVAGAIFDNCNIYGISVWNLKNHPERSSNLVIRCSDKNAITYTITVDNLEVAQFIYLMFDNKKIRDVIDSMASRVVLILGRFTPERKKILNAIRKALRKHNYLPVLFDFDKPDYRDTHETITTLARLSRFVIADITEPKSIPQELVSIVESMPSLPIQPLLQAGHTPWRMYDHIKKYPWVLELQEYNNLDELLECLANCVIAPAIAKSTIVL